MKRFYSVCLLFMAVTCQLALSQERPELLLQRSHSGQAEILAEALSPDLRLAYTVGSEGAVKMWSADAGQVLRTIYDSDAFPEEDNLGVIQSAAFGPDAEWVATLDGEGVVRRFSLPQGALLNSFEVLPAKDGGSLRTDGKALYVVTRNAIMKWSQDGDLEVQTKVDDIYLNQHLVSLSNDRRFLAVGHDRKLIVYQTSDLAQVAAKSIDAPLRAVAFSPDSQQLAFTTELEVMLLAIPSFSEKGQVSFGTHTISYRALVWLGQELYAYTFSLGGQDFLARVDFAKSALEILEPDFPLTSASANSDSTLFLGGYGGDAWIYDPASSEKRALISDIGGFSSFTIHPSTLDLFTGSRGGEVVRWSHQSGRILQQYDGLESWVSSLDVSPDGTKLIGSDFSVGLVVCWDIESGQQISVLNLQRGRFAQGVHWAKWADSTSYLYSAPKRELTLVEAATGKELRTWDIGKGRPTDVAVKDGRLVAGYHGSFLLEADLANKRDMLVTKLPPRIGGSIKAVDYGATNETVFCLDNQGSIYIWDASEPEGEPEFLTRFRDDFSDLEYADGGLRLWLRDGEIRTLDEGGKQQSTINLADKLVWGDHFVLDGVIVALADYFKIGFYDAKTGQRRGRLVGVRNNEGWVAMEESGSFDGNDIGLQTIQFSLGGELYGVDQFLTQYLRPGILSDLLPGTRKNLRTAAPLTASSLKKPPTVKILEPASGTEVSGEKVYLKIEVSPRGSGASDPQVYHNGHKLPQDGLRKLDDSNYVYAVDLVRGKNEFQVSAFDGSNEVESRRDRVRVTAPEVEERAPKLHLLSVGIDSYNSGLTLEFAEADAKSISELFKSELYAPGSRILLESGKASKEGIREALESIAAAAEPQDAFVFYLAGHGTVVDDEYYFLPQDVRTESDEEMQKSSLSSELLSDMLTSVPATKQLLVLDTCRAGKFLKGAGVLYAREGLEEVRSHNLLSRTSGTFLIAATKEEDYAFEVPQLGHGILTYSVLESLGLKKSGDPAVTANELVRSVSQKVPELSHKYHGTRQMVVQYSSGQDFPLTK